VLGEEIHLNGKAYRVVGIMPPSFRFPADADLWIPLRLPYGWDDLEPFRQSLPSRIVARLASGATVDQARSRIFTLVQRFAPPGRPLETSATEVVEPFRDVLVASRRSALLVLLGATGFVLLIACTNVTNLLLSRAASRRTEIALRGALGASRGRIVRQLLVESVILALAGGAAGIVVAVLALGAITALVPASLAGLATAQLDGRVLAFALVVAVTTGIAFGLWPAIGASRTDPGEVIKSGSAGAGGARHTGLGRRIFVVAEIALALMLAVGAGLMLRSLRTLLDNDPGLRAEHVATLELAWERGTGNVGRYERMQAILDRLAAQPDVRAAAFVNELPLRGVVGMSISVHADGKPPGPDAEPLFAQMLQVTPGYFDALGIPILRGTTVPARPDSLAPTVVVNEELANRLWPGASAIGQRMSDPMDERPRTVIGVVGNVRATSLDGEYRPQMYFSLAELSSPNVALIARGPVAPELLAARLGEVVAEVVPRQAVYNVRPMEDVIARTVAPRRLNTLLITTFGVLAVIVAALGVYGLVSFGVAQRSREIGIRMALGASPSDVMDMVMREGLALAAIGAIVGLGGAWMLRRVIESMLYGITPADPIAYAAASLVLICTAVVATLVPAWKATRVNPAETLRAE
jgi:predicted permease